MLLSPAAGRTCAETAPLPAELRAETGQPPSIAAFVREGCPHCERARTFLEQLARERPELRIAIHDLRREPAALDRLRILGAGRAGGLVRVATSWWVVKSSSVTPTREPPAD